MRFYVDLVEKLALKQNLQILNKTFSDITSEEERRKYEAKIKENLSYSRENNLRMEQLEGETIIRPGHHYAFSPHARKMAYITVRTADEIIA